MIRRLLLVFIMAVALVVVLAGGVVAWLFAGDGVRLALERQMSGRLGQPVRIGEATATLLPRLAIRLEQVTVGEPVRMTLGRVDLSTGVRALLARRLEDAEVSVSDSRVEMPLPFGLPAVAATPGGAANEAEASGMQLVSVRRITLRDVTLVSLGRELEIAVDSSLNGSRLAITRFTASAGDLSIDAHGSVDFTPRVVANLQATSSLLDVDSLLALAGAFMGTPAPGNGEDSSDGARLSLHVMAARARAAGIDLTNFDAAVTAYAGEVTLDPLLFDVFGGHHEGWLSATLGDTLDVRVGSSVGDIDVAQLAAFGGAPGSIAGRLSATGRFGARGRDIGAVLTSARGVGDVTIRKGSMRGLGLVRTVLSFFGRSPDTSSLDSGSTFDQVTGTFALGDRRVSSEDLSLESGDVDVLARGTLALDTKALDGRANLVLSEALSAQADRRLYRYTMMGNRVVLPATVGGTLSAPTIGVDAAAAMERAIANEVERRLKDFFERVGPF